MPPRYFDALRFARTSRFLPSRFICFFKLTVFDRCFRSRTSQVCLVFDATGFYSFTFARGYSAVAVKVTRKGLHLSSGSSKRDRLTFPRQMLALSISTRLVTKNLNRSQVCQPFSQNGHVQGNHAGLQSRVAPPDGPKAPGEGGSTQAGYSGGNDPCLSRGSGMSRQPAPGDSAELDRRIRLHESRREHSRNGRPPSSSTPQVLLLRLAQTDIRSMSNDARS